MKVLIAPDKFKGTLTAPAAVAAIAQGWRKARPGDTLNLLPISDGGDGFGLALSGLLRAKVQTIATVDAAHRPIRARWWWDAKEKTAIIESANVIGLAQLPAGKFHPFALDTFGLGAVLRAASARGARRCLIGIGGSATNDGGFGVARALGWEFLNRGGKPILQWTELDKLAEVRATKRTRWFEQLLVAVDVQNPLLGARGCTRIYGPQKGLRPGDFSHAERCLRRLATIAKGDATEPGAGAAGGLGFGLRCFAGARLQAGFDLFARKAQLARHLRVADLVITGEGAIDASTLMGKGVGQLAEWCHRLEIPCVALAGTITAHKKHKGYFAQQYGLMDLTSAKQAQTRAAYWLTRLAERAARDFSALRGVA